MCRAGSRKLPKLILIVVVVHSEHMLVVQRRQAQMRVLLVLMGVLMGVLMRVWVVR